MPVTVSIIIGAYNVARFLPTGLDCILQQSHRQLDIVIVDDGSTDNTGVFCAELAKNDARIKVFHKENGGLASARNFGLDQAQGTYIAFYDVDDTVDLDWIEVQVKLLEETNADMAMHGFTVFDQHVGELDIIRFPAVNIESNQQLKKLFPELFVFVRHGNGFSWNKIYRKSFLDNRNARFGDEKIRQDEPFNLRLYPHLTNVVISEKTPYHYIIYKSGGAGAKYIDDKFALCQSIYLGFERFCAEWGIRNEALQIYNAKRHLGNISNVISANLLHPDCPLTLVQKRDVALAIMTDKDTQDCLAKTRHEYFSPEISFHRFCLQHKLALSMLFASFIRKKIRSKFKKW